MKKQDIILAMIKALEHIDTAGFGLAAYDHLNYCIDYMKKDDVFVIEKDD